MDISVNPVINFKCFRRHTFLNKNYEGRLTTRYMAIGKTVYWNSDGPTLKQFGLKVGKKIKWFDSNHESLCMIRQRIKDLVIFGNLTQLYSPLKSLDHGAYSQVYLVRDNITSKRFAAKCILKEESKNNLDVLNEIKILRELRHQNIVEIQEVFETDQSYHIIMELLTGETLDEYIKKQQHKMINQEDIKQILYNILLGLEHMHSKSVIHRDLKPENIKLKYPGDIQSLKIIDFGLSTYSTVDMYSHPRCGTPGYMAPEVINLADKSQKYTAQCDLFSLGAIAYKLITQYHLFSGETQDQAYLINKKCRINLDMLRIYKKLSQNLLDLVKQLLSKEPEQRPNAFEALCHPYFKESTSMSPQQKHKSAEEIIEIKGLNQQLFSYEAIDDGYKLPEDDFAQKLKTLKVQVNLKKKMQKYSDSQGQEHPTCQWVKHKQFV